MPYTPTNFTTTAVINSDTLFQNYDDEVQVLMSDVGNYLSDEMVKVYTETEIIVTDGIKVNSVETIEDLATQDGVIFKTIIVKDLNRGGTFIWSATGTANGGTVFAGASGYWNRQYSGAVNVKWFGAKGDGVTDDTVAIQSALDSSYTVEFDNDSVVVKQYNITDTLVLKSGHKISGNNRNRYQVSIHIDNGDKDIFYSSEATAIAIRNISFTHSTEVGSGYAIRLLSCVQSVVDGCVVQSSPNGFWLGANSVTQFSGNSYILNNYMANIGHTCLTSYRNHNDHIRGNRFEGGEYSIKFENSCYDCTVTGNEFSHTSVASISAFATTGMIFSSNTFGAHSGDGILTGNWNTIIEGNLFIDIEGRAISGTYTRGSIITGNTFRRCSGGVDGVGFDKYNGIIYLNTTCDGSIIKNNSFTHESQTASAQCCVSIRYSKNIIIKDNSFRGAYTVSAVNDYAPTGTNQYIEYRQNSIITNAEVSAGTNSVKPAIPFTTAGGWSTANINVPYGRALTCTIKNTTASDIKMPASYMYSTLYNRKTLVPEQTIVAGGSITVTGEADDSNRASITLFANGATVPNGLTREFGVSDRFKIRERLTSLTNVSCTINGAVATVSDLKLDGDNSFLVTPSPPIGSTIIFNYMVPLNIE